MKNKTEKENLKAVVKKNANANLSERSEPAVFRICEAMKTATFTQGFGGFFAFFLFAKKVPKPQGEATKRFAKLFAVGFFF